MVLGDHIASLLLRMFLMYLPQVIEAGKVYKAVPPLFGIKQGKGMKYFTTNADLAQYGQSLFVKNHTLLDDKKKAFNHKEITKIFSLNMDYARDMDILSNTLAVNPYLLELVLYEISDIIEFNIQKETAMAMAQDPNSNDGTKVLIDRSINEAISYSIDNLDYKAFKKKIEKKYRFLNVVKDHGIISIQGLVGDLYQYVFINHHTIDICINMIRHIANSSYRYFYMDNQLVTMYTLIHTLDSILPNNIKRYKGLGEQKPSELRESTMDPAKRTLIRYTIESAKEEIENIRYIDSNKAALLNDLTITRQDLE